MEKEKEKNLTGAQRARRERDARVVTLYKEMRSSYDYASILYNDIAKKAGCAPSTVIYILKKYKQI